MKHLLAAVLVVTAVAGPALAIRPCDATDVQCHKTCTLPQFDKQRGVYWNQC
jgi:hypothetical protein